MRSYSRDGKELSSTEAYIDEMSLKDSSDDDSKDLRARVRRIIDEDRALFDELDE